MSLTFGALLYFQIMYLENMVKMREAQFSETVMRCLSSTSSYLERKETLHFLEEDVNIIESSLYDNSSFNPDGENLSYTVESPDGTVTKYTLAAEIDRSRQDPSKMLFPSPTGSIESHYRNMQEIIRSQYLYQKGLLNEVILSILREAGNRPAFERADSTIIKNYLASELANNGLNVPFVIAVTSNKGAILYSTEGYSDSPDVDK